MKKFGVKSVVATAIEAALVFVLLRFVAIPTPFPDTTLSIYAAVVAFFSVLFGPIVGFLGGFLGNLIVDLTAGWGVWWTWDPRLSTALIMCFVYLAWLVLRGLDMPLESRRLVSAVVGVVAFLDVPLVFISARVWRSIHPAVIGSKGGGMTPEMWQTTGACMAAFGLFWAGLLLLRLQQLGDAARLDAMQRRRSGDLLEENA